MWTQLKSLSYLSRVLVRVETMDWTGSRTRNTCVTFTYFHSFPSDLLSSEFWRCGCCCDMTRRAAWAQTMNAFMGRLMCSFLRSLGCLEEFREEKRRTDRQDMNIKWDMRWGQRWNQAKDYLLSVVCFASKYIKILFIFIYRTKCLE